MPVLISLGVLALLALAFVLYAYRTAFYSPKRKAASDGYTLPDDPALDDIRVRFARIKDEVRAASHEQITVTSHDGLRLCGLYYENRAGAPLCIAFHGYRSGPVGDGAGAFRIARDNGYNLLTVYQRAHGKSDGRTISFGIRESEDVMRWIEYAVARFGEHTPIFLSGISMGAATVLTALSKPLPKNIVGVIADCSYSSTREILRKVTRDMKLPVGISYVALCVAARLFGGFHPEQISPIEAVRHARVPVCFIHGEADDFVPFSMVHELYEACASEKTLLTFPGAGHGLSYLCDSERYEREVLAFEARCLAAFEDSFA